MLSWIRLEEDFAQLVFERPQNWDLNDDPRFGALELWNVIDRRH